MSKDKRKQKFQYEDMSGDIVYDSIKDKEFRGFTLLGGRLIEARPPMLLTQPRKVIELGFEHNESKIIRKLSFNYLKIKRRLIKEERYG